MTWEIRKSQLGPQDMKSKLGVIPSLPGLNSRLLLEIKPPRNGHSQPSGRLEGLVGFSRVKQTARCAKPAMEPAMEDDGPWWWLWHPRFGWGNLCFFRCHVSISCIDRYVYVCTEKYTRIKHIYIYIHIYYRYDIQNYIYKQKNIYTLAEYSCISILMRCPTSHRIRTVDEETLPTTSQSDQRPSTVAPWGR